MVTATKRRQWRARLVMVTSVGWRRRAWIPRGRLFRGYLPLGDYVLQMTQNSHSQRMVLIDVLVTEAFGHLGDALLETDVVIVHREFTRIVAQRIATCGHKEITISVDGSTSSVTVDRRDYIFYTVIMSLENEKPNKFSCIVVHVYECIGRYMYGVLFKLNN